MITALRALQFFGERNGPAVQRVLKDSWSDWNASWVDPLPGAHLGGSPLRWRQSAVRPPAIA